MMKPRVLLLCVLLSACGSSELPLQEPSGGTLAAGESALVNDGKCPAGQVNKVTGPSTLTGTRTYSCVKRPSRGLF